MGGLTKEVNQLLERFILIFRFQIDFDKVGRKRFV